MMGEAPAVHPGEILREEFLKPLGISSAELAADLAMPIGDVERLVRMEAAVTPDIARGLMRRFGTSAEFWLNLQAHHDALI